MKLVQPTIEEFITKFLGLLYYIPYLKAKVQRFMSYIPQNYRDKMEFENPKTMEEAIRQEKLCYTQFKKQEELSKSWKTKKNIGQRKKGFKPSPFRQLSRNYQYGNFKKNITKQNLLAQSVNKPFHMGNKGSSEVTKGNVQCWGC